MSKTVYSWDNDNHFDSIKIVDDDYELAANETFDKPEDGLYEPITRTNNKWVGTSKEEWEANQPKVDVKPTAQQQANAQMSLQLAQLMKKVGDQDKLNVRLTIDVAMLKKQQNGATGNNPASMPTAPTTPVSAAQSSSPTTSASADSAAPTSEAPVQA